MTSSPTKKLSAFAAIALSAVGTSALILPSTVPFRPAPHVSLDAPAPLVLGLSGSPRRTDRGAPSVFSRQRRRAALALSRMPEGNPLGSGGATNIDPGVKLLLCILIDLVGIASYGVPALGEAADLGWAPVSALLVNYLFGNGVFTALAFVEELLPGFDIIPTATIAWFLENAAIEEREGTAPPSPPSGVAPPPPPSTRKAPPERLDKADVIDVEIVD